MRTLAGGYNRISKAKIGDPTFLVEDARFHSYEVYRAGFFRNEKLITYDCRDKKMRTYNYRHEKCAVDDYRDDNQTAVDTVTGFVVTNC